MAYSPNGIVAMPLNGHPKTTAMTHALHARLCSLRSAAAVATATHIMANELGKNAVDAIANQHRSTGLLGSLLRADSS